MHFHKILKVLFVEKLNTHQKLTLSDGDRPILQSQRLRNETPKTTYCASGSNLKCDNRDVVNDTCVLEK